MLDMKMASSRASLPWLVPPNRSSRPDARQPPTPSKPQQIFDICADNNYCASAQPVHTSEAVFHGTIRIFFRYTYFEPPLAFVSANYCY